MSTYYTLFVRDEDTGIFHDEFGDYTRSSVKEEADCTYWDRKKSDLKIVNTGGTAQLLIAAGRKLNGEVAA